MLFSQRYKNTIWTNHVVERLKDRNIPQELALQALRYPDTTKSGNTSGSKEFTKHINNHTITVIAAQNEKREWVIMSCWANPPFKGSIDIDKKKRYLQYKHSTLTGKIWIRFKQALGLYGDF